MRAIVLLVLLVGCEPTTHEAMVRWPKHRDLEEKRIADLETEVKVLEARIVQLEQASAAK